MKNATIYLDDEACFVTLVLEDGTCSVKSGITEKNIMEYVDIVVARGYRVMLYRVSNPEYFLPQKTK